MISFLDNQPQLEEILADAPPLAPPPLAAPLTSTAPPTSAGLSSATGLTPAAAESIPSAEPTPATPAAPAPAVPTQGVLALRGDEILERPDVVEARVYRLRSGFVRHNVYITLGWVEQAGQRRPMEIFFNSKDLTRSPEYAILTRLISALFRKSADPAFILEELRGIHDPAGGVYKNGRYMLSFYAEVAEVIERFFYDVGILRPQVADFAGLGGTVPPTQTEVPDGPGMGSSVSLEKSVTFPDEVLEMGQPGFPSAPRRTPDASNWSQAQAQAQTQANAQFKICPECSQRTLKLENGCDSCLSCGYSKCDK